MSAVHALVNRFNAQDAANPETTSSNFIAPASPKRKPLVAKTQPQDASVDVTTTSTSTTRTTDPSKRGRSDEKRVLPSSSSTDNKTRSSSVHRRTKSTSRKKSNGASSDSVSSSSKTTKKKTDDNDDDKTVQSTRSSRSKSTSRRSKSAGPPKTRSKSKGPSKSHHSSSNSGTSNSGTSTKGRKLVAASQAANGEEAALIMAALEQQQQKHQTTQNNRATGSSPQRIRAKIKVKGPQDLSKLASVLAKQQGVVTTPTVIKQTQQQAAAAATPKKQQLAVSGEDPTTPEEEDDTETDSDEDGASVTNGGAGGGGCAEERPYLQLDLSSLAAAASPMQRVPSSRKVTASAVPAPAPPLTPKTPTTPGTPGKAKRSIGRGISGFFKNRSTHSISAPDTPTPAEDEKQKEDNDDEEEDDDDESVHHPANELHMLCVPQSPSVNSSSHVDNLLIQVPTLDVCVKSLGSKGTISSNAELWGGSSLDLRHAMDMIKQPQDDDDYNNDDDDDDLDKNGILSLNKERRNVESPKRVRAQQAQEATSPKPRGGKRTTTVATEEEFGSPPSSPLREKMVRRPSLGWTSRRGFLKKSNSKANVESRSSRNVHQDLSQRGDEDESSFSHNADEHNMLVEQRPVVEQQQGTVKRSRWQTIKRKVLLKGRSSQQNDTSATVGTGATATASASTTTTTAPAAEAAIAADPKKVQGATRIQTAWRRRNRCRLYQKQRTAAIRMQALARGAQQRHVRRAAVLLQQLDDIQHRKAVELQQIEQDLAAQKEAAQAEYQYQSKRLQEDMVRELKYAQRSQKTIETIQQRCDKFQEEQVQIHQDSYAMLLNCIDQLIATADVSLGIMSSSSA